jgi:hypothetical protein
MESLLRLEIAATVNDMTAKVYPSQVVVLLNQVLYRKSYFSYILVEHNLLAAYDY